MRGFLYSTVDVPTQQWQELLHACRASADETVRVAAERAALSAAALAANPPITITIPGTASA